MNRFTLLLVLAVVLPVRADASKAEKLVKAELEKLKVAPELARVIDDEGLTKTFPGSTFVAVVFPQFPIARSAPEPLKSNNIYVVDAGGKLSLITGQEGISGLFKKSKIGEKEADQKAAVRAWLTLAQELQQDGFFKFKIDADSLKGGDGRAEGKVLVVDGGKGSLAVVLTIKDGVVSSSQEQVQIERGMRPRILGEDR